MNSIKTITLLITLLTGLNLGAQATSGIASYYAPGLHGHKTSNGERYNHQAMTCANKDFPLGTMLKVTRADDGRSVVVRVNDCGPHRAGRIIDLSGAAALKMGLIRDGITQVNLEVVSYGKGRLACGGKFQAAAPKKPASYNSIEKRIDDKPQEPKAAQPIEGQGTYRAEALQPIESGYGVQVGSYRVYSNAASVAADLQAKGYSKVLIRLQGNVHQVVLGPFETRENADTYRRNLRKNYNMKGFVTLIKG